MSSSPAKPMNAPNTAIMMVRLTVALAPHNTPIELPVGIKMPPRSIGRTIVGLVGDRAPWKNIHMDGVP